MKIASDRNALHLFRLMEVRGFEGGVGVVVLMEREGEGATCRDKRACVCKGSVAMYEHKASSVNVLFEREEWEIKHLN